MSNQISRFFKQKANISGWANWSPHTPDIGESNNGQDNRHALAVTSNGNWTPWVAGYLTTTDWTSNGGIFISEAAPLLLPSGNGYTQGTQITGPTTVSIDQVSGAVKVEFGTVNWTATGGPIGPVRGMFITGFINAETDATAEVKAAGPTMIIGWVDFGTLITQDVGGVLTVKPSLLIT